MFIRKYWLPLTVFIVALVGVGLYYLQTRPPKPPILIAKPVEPLEKPTVEVSPVGETSQGGDVHEDGDPLHAETHDPLIDEQQPIEVGSPPPGGHWSEAYLPPLEELKDRYAGDTEATFVLNNVEILQKYGYYSDHPEAGEARTALVKFFNSIFARINIRGNPEGRRRVEELLKLKWSLYDSPPGSSAELAQWASLKGERDEE